MKVLLATPPHQEKLESFYPNLGLLYLASFGRLHAQKVSPEFYYLEGGEYDSIERYVASIKSISPDVIGLSFATHPYRFVYRSISAIKEELPEVPIVCGGPHPTVMPVHVLENTPADICVIGEGEVTFSEILKTLQSESISSLKKIRGIAFRNKDSISLTPPRAFIKELDSIPFPAWDIIDFRKYKGYRWKKASPETCMASTRGCLFNCTFCSNPVWKSSKPWLRMRSPANIAEEISLLYHEYGVREFYDWADELNCVRPWALKVCDEIGKLKLTDAYFKCQLRADKVSDELVDKLKKIGCWHVELGIESGNQRVLNGIQKGITLEQVVHASSVLKRYGIKVLGFFMIMNIWEENGKLMFETPEMCENTFRFARKLLSRKLLSNMSWSIATPIPGSRMYDIAQRHKLIGDFEDLRFDTDYPIMRLPGITEKEISRIKRNGMMTQAYYALRSGDLNWGDIKFFLSKLKALTYHLGRSLT